MRGKMAKPPRMYASQPAQRANLIFLLGAMLGNTYIPQLLFT